MRKIYEFDGTKLGDAISVGANILKGVEEVYSFPIETVKKVGKDMGGQDLIK
ncbi:MAG: hypothetical protein Q8784_00960 [Vigna little leaf phytoplasma]|nr:hypothetical protein [Vigna little leaf phytoplasma]